MFKSVLVLVCLLFVSSTSFGRPVTLSVARARLNRLDCEQMLGSGPAKATVTFMESSSTDRAWLKFKLGEQDSFTVKPKAQWRFLRELMGSSVADKRYVIHRKEQLQTSFIQMIYFVGDTMSRPLPGNIGEMAEHQKRFIYETLAKTPGLLAREYLDAIFTNLPEAIGDLGSVLLDLAFRDSLRGLPPTDALTTVSRALGVANGLSSKNAGRASQDQLRDYVYASSDLIRSMNQRPFARVGFEPNVWQGKTIGRTIDLIRLLQSAYALRGSLMRDHRTFRNHVPQDADWTNLLSEVGLLDATVSRVSLESQMAAVRAYVTAQLSSRFGREVVASLGHHLLPTMHFVAQMMAYKPYEEVIEETGRLLKSYERDQFHALKFATRDENGNLPPLSVAQMQAWSESHAQVEVTNDSLLVTLNLQGIALLGIGELTGSSTCMNPKIGGLGAVSTLAFATDYNTQAVAGFTIPAKRFSVDDWNRLVQLGRTADVVVDEWDWKIGIKFSGQGYLEIPLPETAVVRRIIRIGKTASGQPGFGFEPIYRDPTVADYLPLRKMLDTYVSNWAAKVGASTGQAITVQKSGLAPGTYSDATRDTEREDFKMPAAQWECDSSSLLQR